jgi:hypothetical protein
MAVITVDILVEDMKRNDVLAWLGEADHHDRILQGAWDKVERKGDRDWDLSFKAGPKSRTMGYTFERLDDSHGGRRALCTTSGKRTSGKLHYSLRTPRASRNTLVTLHMDYEPGGLLGRALNAAGLEDGLTKGMTSMLDNLRAAIYADAGS